MTTIRTYDASPADVAVAFGLGLAGVREIIEANPRALMQRADGAYRFLSGAVLNVPSHWPSEMVGLGNITSDPAYPAINHTAELLYGLLADSLWRNGSIALNSSQYIGDPHKAAIAVHAIVDDPVTAKTDPWLATSLGTLYTWAVMHDDPTWTKPETDAHWAKVKVDMQSMFDAAQSNPPPQTPPDGVVAAAISMFYAMEGPYAAPPAPPVPGPPTAPSGARIYVLSAARLQKEMAPLDAPFLKDVGFASTPWNEVPWLWLSINASAIDWKAVEAALSPITPIGGVLHDPQTAVWAAASGSMDWKGSVPPTVTSAWTGPWKAFPWKLFNPKLAIPFAKIPWKNIDWTHVDPSASSVIAAIKSVLAPTPLPIPITCGTTAHPDPSGTFCLCNDPNLMWMGSSGCLPQTPPPPYTTCPTNAKGDPNGPVPCVCYDATRAWNPNTNACDLVAGPPPPPPPSCPAGTQPSATDPALCSCNDPALEWDKKTGTCVPIDKTTNPPVVVKPVSGGGSSSSGGGGYGTAIGWGLALVGVAAIGIAVAATRAPAAASRKAKA